MAARYASLELRQTVALLRERFGLLAAESARQRARARTLTAQSRRSREGRWTTRYDRAFARHDQELRDAGLGDG